jgi:hypothetical protein
VDGNKSMRLGMIWKIIIRLKIKDIKIEEKEKKENKYEKDDLLMWCKMKNEGYKNVNVRKFKK